MKAFFMMVVLILAALSSKAQPNKYFEREFNFTWIENGFSVTDTDVGGYLVIGSSLDSLEAPIWKGIVLKTNNYGDMINGYTYTPFGNSVTLYKILKIDPNKYAFVGYEKKIYTQKFYGVFGFLDSAANPITYNYVGDTTFNQVALFCLNKSNDNSYIVAGHRFITSRVLYAVKVDSVGNTIWEKSYTQLSQPDSDFFNVINTPDGNHVLVGATGYLDNYYTGDIMLAKISSQDGAVLWSKKIDYGGHEIGARVLVDKYENYFISARKGTDGFLLKLDSLRNVLWYNDTSFKKMFGGGIIFCNDSSSLLFYGSCRPVPSDNPIDMTIKKIDTSGTILWERIYGYPDGNDYGYDAKQTADGGYVITGRKESGTVGSNIWLVRTNCMGLISYPQAAFSYAPINPDSLKLTYQFQNLSQFVYPDSIDGGYFIWDFGDGVNTNELNPTHTYVAEGIYTVKLMGIVCGDTSVYEEPLNTNALLVKETNCVSTNLQIVPNPNNGTFKIQYAGSSNNTLQCTIYNVMGNKVLCQELPITEHSISIQQSQLQQGLYLCVIQTKQGIVAKQKFVVVK